MEGISLITEDLKISSSAEIRNCLVAATEIHRLRWQSWGKSNLDLLVLLQLDIVRPGYNVEGITLQTGCRNHPVSSSLDTEVHFSGASLINILCGVGNFGKFWSACGQYEIQYREWRM